MLSRTLLATSLFGASIALSCSAIPKAPEGSPRIEVELAIEIEDPFVEPLQIDDRKALNASFDDAVLSRADIGLRFYPVLSELYTKDSQRPPYLLRVTARDLSVEYDHKTKKAEEGEEPEVITTLSALRCNVTVTLERRRPDAPPLPVARAKKEVHWKVGDPDAGTDIFPLQPDPEGEEGLTVAQDDVMLGVDRAVAAALKELVESIDRELSLTERGAAAEKD